MGEEEKHGFKCAVLFCNNVCKKGVEGTTSPSIATYLECKIRLVDLIDVEFGTDFEEQWNSKGGTLIGQHCKKTFKYLSK